MAMTQYGDISQRTADWAAATMLKHAEPILCLNLFVQLFLFEISEIINE